MNFRGVPRMNVVAMVFAVSVTAGAGNLAVGQTGPGCGPYIDSVGFRAAQARLDAVDAESPDSLINQAFGVQKKQQPDVKAQPEFFKSIEESYQRYRKLFTLHKRGAITAVYCEYDVLETFRLEVFDPQPFLNAILHTFSMTDVTTLTYGVLSRSPDRIIVRASWSRAVQQGNKKGFSITEGSSDLNVTKNWISFVSNR
jgi:hypothetical protein